MNTINACRRSHPIVGAFLMGLSFILLAPTIASAEEAQSKAPIKVVYHIDDHQRAIGALRSISNHLKAEPESRVVVVTLAHGIDFLLRGAKDDRGNPYEPMIDDLLFAGVEFRICNNTIAARNIERAQIVADVQVVDSGVAEISRLQAWQNFVYIKP